MSLAERLMHLVLEANAKAEAFQRQVTTLEEEVRTAEEEMRAARDAVVACRRDLDQRRSQRDDLLREQERRLAELQATCDRLGIRGPDAS